MLITNEPRTFADNLQKIIYCLGKPEISEWSKKIFREYQDRKLYISYFLDTNDTAGRPLLIITVYKRSWFGLRETLVYCLYYYYTDNTVDAVKFIPGRWEKHYRSLVEKIQGINTPDIPYPVKWGRN